MRYYLTKVFYLDLESIETILAWMMAHFPSSILEKVGTYKLELSFEEILVNIMEHAYLGKKEPVYIYLGFDESGVRVEFRDRGPPFDPLKFNKKENVSTDLAKMTLGGHGLTLIKSMIKGLSYAYVSPYNVLCCQFDS